jgi:hypothetical protein
MKHKKGQFAITITSTVLIIALIVIFLIVGGSLIAIFSNLPLLIGGALIVLPLIAIGNSYVKKGKIERNAGIFFVILILIGAVLVFSSGSIMQSITGTGQYVETPTIGYYECAPASGPVSSNWEDIPISGTGFIGCPSNTDQCDIEIRAEKPTVWDNFLREYRLVYQVCDDFSCQNQVTVDADRFDISGDYATLIYNNLQSNEKIWIDYQKRPYFTWKGAEGGEYRFKYRPFILWKTTPFSGRNEYSTISQGCSFTTEERNNLIKSATIPLPSETSSSNFKLDPYKTRNFVDVFVPISVENVQFVNYNGKDSYCVDGNVYKIDEISTNSGTYQIVDTSDNTLLKDGQCCPGDEEPGRYCEDFEWVNVETDEDGETNIECSLFNPCPNSIFEPKDSTTLFKFECQNGQCVELTKNVECTDNSVCAEGEICDTKTFTCETVPTEDEDTTTDKQCAWYQELKTVNEIDRTWYNYIGIGEPEVITSEQCKTADWVYLVSVIFIVIVLGLAVILTRPKGGKK